MIIQGKARDINSIKSTKFILSKNTLKIDTNYMIDEIFGSIFYEKI